MENDLQNIDQLFRSRLAGVKEAPPAPVWDKIEQSLDKQVASAPVYRFRKQRDILLVLLFFVTIVAGVLIWQIEDEEDEQDHNNIVSVHTAPPAIVAAPDNRISPIVGTGATAANQVVQQHVNKMQAVMILPPHVLPQIAEFVHSETPPVAQPESIHKELALTVPFQKMMHDPTTQITFSAATQLAKMDKKPARKNRISLTAFFSPEFNSAHTEQDRWVHMDERREEINRTEKKEVTYSAGILAEYRLNKHWSIQSGITFSRPTTSIRPKTIFARYDDDGLVKYRFNLSSGYGYIDPKSAPPVPLVAGDSVQSFGSRNVLNYIGIPVSVKYNYAWKRFNLFAQAGITVKFLTEQNTATAYFNGFGKENSNIPFIRGLKTNYFTGTLALGMDYAISKRLALTIFPSYNFAVSSINKNAPVKTSLNGIGLASGIKINL